MSRKPIRKARTFFSEKEREEKVSSLRKTLNTCVQNHRTERSKNVAKTVFRRIPETVVLTLKEISTIID